MRIKEKLRTRLHDLPIRKRLVCSNILMFLIPVVVTAVSAASAFGIATHAFVRFYLPRMGLTLKSLHDMGEQYEKDLISFMLLITVLIVITLLLLVLSIVITNRFLTKFMFRRIEEPLAILTEGAARIGSGELSYSVKYDRKDEFRPVCDAFNGMSARLKAQADRAAAEEQSRRELFAGISHDLRSPLTSVRAYTEALLDGVARSPEDTHRYLTKIRLHEAEIEHMVEALFLYSKMELQDYPVHLQRLDVREEAERICAENPFDAHLEVDISGVPHIDVIADPFLLERVMLNLLDNSRKYRRNDTAHAHLTAKRCEGKVLLSVADDGIGVPEELLPRLFDPFYRTDPSRTNPAGGSGLGLAVVREAIKHMNGSVRAENVPAGGLNIIITLQEAEDDGKHSDNRG